MIELNDWSEQMTKRTKASDYTHSVWSGKQYAKPQTMAELVAESMKVLRAHPTISKCLVTKKDKVS